MRKFLLRLLAMALAAAGAVAYGAPAVAHRRCPPQVITVLGTAEGGVELSRHTACAGRITFVVESAAPAGESSGIGMFRLTRHATVADVLADIRNQFSDDPAIRAKGTRDATRHARFYGLADVAAGGPAAVTQTLAAGTYYLISPNPMAAGPWPVTTLRVRHRAGGHHGDHAHGARHQTTVYMASHRFITPPVLPAHGTVSVHNASNTLHTMTLWAVQPGTTDADVQAAIEDPEEGEDLFVDGPFVGLFPLSPGRRVQLTYQLPAGTYLMFCGVPDRHTGLRHYELGMYKVVTLA